MGNQARINKKLKLAAAKTPEAIAAQLEQQKKTDNEYARRMGAHLINQKRSMAEGAVSRFARQWMAKPWEELVAALPHLRDDAMTIAFSSYNGGAYRAAMTLIAFDADLTAGGIEQLAKSVEAQLPLDLWKSNDKTGLEAERATRARELAGHAYHIGLAEALGDVSFIQSLRAPSGPVDEDAGPPVEQDARRGSSLTVGTHEGVEMAPDFDAPMMLVDDAGNPEPPDLGEVERCGDCGEVVNGDADGHYANGHCPPGDGLEGLSPQPDPIAEELARGTEDDSDEFNIERMG